MPYNRLLVTTVFLATITALETSVVKAWEKVALELVPIGNAGNAPDDIYSVLAYGSVSYPYQMGKYEVTAGQYTAFLNAVAADDLHELYNVAMDYHADPTHRGCNIQQTGAPGEYRYSVPADWENRPVNYVSHWDAVRFANWMHNGQTEGAQGPATTEDGAYSLLGDPTIFSFVRKANSRYFLPSVDEWFKAAYHNSAAGTAGSYFAYPTGTDAEPGTDPTEFTRPANNMNVGDVNLPSFGPPYFRTPVGEFELSASPYGTFDQGGNVAEWTDSLSGCRGVCFHWANSAFDNKLAHAHDQFLQESPGEHAETELPMLGFRVAAKAVPEPSSGALMVLTAAAYGLLRRRIG